MMTHTQTTTTAPHNPSSHQTVLQQLKDQNESLNKHEKVIIKEHARPKTSAEILSFTTN